MEKIEWDSSYSVGTAILDYQHKLIIKTINLMISHYNATVRSAMISELLKRLCGYASEHFRKEEHFLEKIGYLEIEQHKEQHKAYRLKVADFYLKTMGCQESVPTDFLRFVRDWWENHILESDMEYHPFTGR